MIAINNLTKSFKDVEILKKANYQFPNNGLVCIVGASGSGKSTLLNILAGFDSSFDGSVEVLGKEISKLKKHELTDYRKENIGFIFQEYNLLKGYSVIENVLMGLSEKATENDVAKAMSLLKELGLEVKQYEKIENLSGGQKQRVAIARALIKNPNIILADEPTGALDRKNSTEVMTKLHDIASDKLVIVITHDNKLTEFADSVLTIDNGDLVEVKKSASDSELSATYKESTSKKSTVALSKKNVTINLKKFIAVAIAIAVGLTSFIFSLSFIAVLGNSIDEFKEKNTAFNNGYIKFESDDVYNNLINNELVENVYYQYKLSDISLVYGSLKVEMKEKIPMPKATESMSYGVMPKDGANEIALTPSVAKQFATDISKLINEKIVLLIDGFPYEFMVSGIYNAGYDDFFISSDVEQTIFAKLGGKTPYSISFDVKEFEDVVTVYDELTENEVTVKMANEQVESLVTNFNSISKLFTAISILIVAIAVFISAVLLVKMQSTRYKEMGLLMALGYHKNGINLMIMLENLFLSTITCVISCVLVALLYGAMTAFGMVFAITIMEIAISILATFVIIFAIALITSLNLLKLEPAEAFRK